MKITNFRGDLTDISAKKEALLSVHRPNQYLCLQAVKPSVRVVGSAECVNSILLCTQRTLAGIKRSFSVKKNFFEHVNPVSV